MATFRDWLETQRNDLGAAVDKIPREAMVGVGLGLASGQPGAPLQGFAQGMGARQQGLADAEERAMKAETHQLKLRELDTKIAGLELDNQEKEILTNGSAIIRRIQRQNPKASPEDVLRLAGLETGRVDWLEKTITIGQKEQQRKDLQEYRAQLLEQGDARTGISVINAETNRSNAQTNQQRQQMEFEAKQAEKSKAEQLAVQGLDQQSTTAGAAFEEGNAKIDELLAHPGFDSIYGQKGSAAEAVGDRVANVVGSLADPERNDANALRDAISSDAVLKEFQQQKEAGVSFGAATESEWTLLGKAAVEAANPNQSPAQAKRKWAEYKERRQKLYSLMQEDYRKRREITTGKASSGAHGSGGSSAPAERPAQLVPGETVYKGHVYKGGPPNDPKSWSKR